MTERKETENDIMLQAYAAQESNRLIKEANISARKIETRGIQLGLPGWKRREMKRKCLDMVESIMKTI